VGAAFDTFGRADIVVNNAGILRDRPLTDMTELDFERVLRVHLWGTLLVTKAAWPHLRDQGYGRVVNTTSPSGYLGNAGQANYAAAKGGIIALTKSLAMEGAPHGILVNAVAPAALTRMFDEHLPRMPAGVAAVVEQLDPELAAPVVAFLAHESCAITGEILLAAGGRFARVFVAQTRGFYSTTLSPEDVRDHLDEVMASDQPLVLDHPSQQLRILAEFLGTPY
jgi:NAD(P)-dependent dehydrogenase (short-subunit alcohol dehydrogenase family)